MMLLMNVCHFLVLLCSISEAIHSRKIKFLTKLQLSDNILFKTFAKSISEELVNLSSIDAAIF